MRFAWSPVPCLLLLAACSTTAHLESFPIDQVEEHLVTPTGTLEETDALGLAYTILATERFMSGVLVAADQVPGIRRSNAYARADAERCTQTQELVTTVDFECLGYPAGEMTLRARAKTPNENGDYDVELKGVDLAEGETIDGSAVLRVEGVANPTAVERSLLVPIARFGGFPDRFAALEQVAVRVQSERGSESIDCLSSILGETYVFHVMAVEDAAFNYTVRDAKNIWTCRSELEGRRVGKGECRTPVGQGDYAVLRF